MKTQFMKFTLAASIGLALALTLSCGEVDGGDDGGSSSSNGGSSSGSDSKGNDIASYRIVVIGTQTWMAENLNYAVEGSKCYENSEANCDKYGRLYDWSTAMALPSSCNSNFCAEQINSPHQGICPSGWHIPTTYEWDMLVRYVDGTSDMDDRPYSSETAGKHLKAASGWNNNGNGEDAYDFSALPGGAYSDDDVAGWLGVGDFGGWWSSGEYRNKEYRYNDYAYFRGMDYDSERAYWNDIPKSFLVSVRCIQDNINISSSSSRQSGTIYGSPVTYEDKAYKTVVIGDQTWMAENLNYAVEGSKCYDNSEANCDTYGRLYDWITAMALPSSCNSASCASLINSPHQGICPSGWHIPTTDEWEILKIAVGVGGSYTAGLYLKATSGWNNCGSSGSGNGYLCEDTYGFSALPGGWGYVGYDGYVGYVVYFDDAGYYGNWWSAGEYDGDYAYYRYMYDTNWRVNGGSHMKSSLFSVRCVQD